MERIRRVLTAPLYRDVPADDEPEAAVLVALFEEAGEARVVLTRRAATLRSHRGEVSFPGGRVEPGESLVSGALREAGEEVGLDPSAVEVIGGLGQLRTVASGAKITPVVGLLLRRPMLRANPSEVERVFDVSLSALLDDGVHRSERWGKAPDEIEIQFFDLPEDIVWGATARVLVDLLRRVTGLGPFPGTLAAGARPPGWR